MTTSRTIAVSTIGILLLAWAGTPARAGKWELSGSVGLELRGFLESPAFAGQLEGVQASVLFDPEVRFTSESRADRFVLAPFFRLDAEDDERTHFDLREAYWLHVGEGWELTLGARRVFWGVAESRHLVDVLNQVDGVEDVDEEDRLGQPMAALTLHRDWGELSFFALPGFRERTEAGREGRLRPPLPVDEDGAVFESAAGDEHVDFAVRWSHYIGDWDVGVHLFHGTEREARYLPSADGTRLLPHHDQVRQLGIDVQYTRGAWLWKLEALYRDRDGHGFAAGVAGFEYTRYGIGESAADLGLLFEVLRDGRNPERAPATAFESDAFVGARLALNDTQDTQVLAGAIVDPDNGATLLTVEAERRLGESFKLELEARGFGSVADDAVLSSVGADDHVTVRLSWFF